MPEDSNLSVSNPSGGETLDAMMAPFFAKPVMPAPLNRENDKNMEGSYCNGPLTPPETLPGSGV